MKKTFITKAYAASEHDDVSYVKITMTKKQAEGLIRVAKFVKTVAENDLNSLHSLCLSPYQLGIEMNFYQGQPTSNEQFNAEIAYGNTFTTERFKREYKGSIKRNELESTDEEVIRIKYSYHDEPYFVFEASPKYGHIGERFLTETFTVGYLKNTFGI